MVDIAVRMVSPVLHVGQWFAAPIWRQFKYLYKYSSNFKNLEKEVKKLESTRDEVQRKITAAENNVEEIKQEVKDWKTDVEETITKAKQLIEEKANTPRCFKGLCPNFIARYKESKKAFKLKRVAIDLLLKKEKDLNPVSFSTNPPEIWLRSSDDYLAFESRKSTVKNVWDALNDQTVDKIGVYGMGGIGKTTLVQEIGRNAAKEKLFKEIVFVEVTESPDTKKILTIIAKKLGLYIKNESESEIANKIYERMKDKNILLILDNIWEPLDLTTTFGIPSPADRGRNKLLITTRNLDVLEKMDCTNNFGMGILNQEEAWTLFTKMAGNVIQTRELHSLPNDVCNECGGLPIVICTIAKALKHKRRPSEWRVALRELRAPSPTQSTKFLEEGYKKIVLSYNYLGDELKEIFLISSLLENNTSISDLFKLVVCLDILKGANMTMEDKRDKLDELVHDLKDACLLLDGFRRGQFAMHDVIRVVAISIAYLDHHVFTTRNDVEGEWKNKDKLKKCTKIFLPADNTIISQLWPNDLDCPNLEYFSMTNTWNSSFQIPENLFRVMPKLRLLNLVGLQQSSLPLSIDLLTNLQTLCLDYSIIEDVAIIGKLKKLKVLSLQGASIKELPIEIGQLTQLRLLDLTNCWKLEVIAPNVISKLSQLEELHIKGCAVQWQVEVLKELKLLSDLTSLELDIKDNEVLPKDFFSKELKRYQISIGNMSRKKYRVSIGDMLHTRYQISKRDMPSYYTIVDMDHEILRKLEFIFNSTISLEELCGIKNVQILYLARDLDDENDHKQTLFFNKKVIFYDLKVLKLEDIISRKIWDSRLPTSSFQNLKQLMLWTCAKIKYVFPSSIAEGLQQLQFIQIMGCDVLEGIVDIEEQTEAPVNVFFPQVTKLELQYLPEFTDCYPRIHYSEWPKLKGLEMSGCDKVKTFTSEPKSLCLDKKINHDLDIFQLTDPVGGIVWRSESKFLGISRYKSANFPLEVLQRFENLTVLDVKECHRFVNLITPSTARSLAQLRELRILDCRMLIEILENEGDATTENIFEKLNKLSLYGLESLVCFYSGNYTLNIPFLEELNIKKCSNMKTFCGGDFSTPKLKKINYEEMEVEIEGNDLNRTLQGLCKKQSQDISVDFKYKVFQHDNSTETCYNQHPISFYQNLTHLALWNCGNIKYAFPSYIAKSLHQLQQLRIINCKVLEEIVAKEDGTNAVVNFNFPNLTSLKLEDLPELTVFCPGINNLELLKLKEFVVKKCVKYVSFKEISGEIELNILDPQSIFLDNKINFNLEVFELHDSKRNICWQSQSKTLKINDDNSANIPLLLLQRFENVRELVLFKSHYKNVQRLCDLPNLEVLNVRDNIRLMSLVPFLESFQNLKVLKVCGCLRLIMKLITPSVAKSLVQLRDLSISRCDMLNEIVENEGDATIHEIVFSNLSKLSLDYLECLTCFCSGNYCFSFPSLEELFIQSCPNLKFFCQGSLSTPKLYKVIYMDHFRATEVMEIGENDLNTSIQQQHNKKVDCSSKERLTLSGRDIMTTLQGEFQENFGKVKTLQLIEDKCAYISINIIMKFINLENLILTMSSYEEIFSCGEGEECVEVLAKLKDLELLGLFNLKCIWEQDFRFKSILQNLHSLHVKNCYKLMTLLPPSSSFENLTYLKVKYCNGMQNVMTSSTAKSLVCLEKLSIEGCEMMKEVLANEGEIEKDEVVFEKLHDLSLCELESLTCFCSGNYILKFPFLQSLRVRKCFKMKTFSGEGLNMPRLERVNWTRCTNDLNLVVQQLQKDCSKLWESFP